VAEARKNSATPASTLLCDVFVVIDSIGTELITGEELCDAIAVNGREHRGYFSRVGRDLEDGDERDSKEQGDHAERNELTVEVLGPCKMAVLPDDVGGLRGVTEDHLIAKNRTFAFIIDSMLLEVIGLKDYKC